MGSALLFFAYVLFRVWPSFGGDRKPLRAILKDARARIDAAEDDAERAEALCDAGDACAVAVGRGGAAMQFYLRAMRVAPRSEDVAKRAIAGLSHRPRVLEKLLWRRLGSEPWTGPTKPVTELALAALLELYRHKRPDASRARAIERALESLRS